MEITEARLSRVLQHISDDEICFISACRHEYSNRENKKRTDRLENDLRFLHYSYIQVIGGYTEDAGTPEETEVIESSLFVINNGNPDFVKEMLWLCGKYEQDSILLKTTELTPGWYNRQGERVSPPLTKFTIHDIADGFTKIHGSKFSLLAEDPLMENNSSIKQNFSSHMNGVWLRKLMETKKYKW